jgi:branched-chain amino acid transport system substrate-binding protein
MVAVESHASGLTDFKGYLSRILMAEPEVIFISDYYNETATIAKQVRALGYKGPLIGGDGWDSPKLVELAGEAIEGCFFINHFAVDDPNRASKEFVANFIVKYRIVPDAIAVLAYDSVNLVLEAVQRAESVEGAAIQAALLTAKTETVCGSLTFDAYRNPIKPAVVLQIKEGKHVYYATVEP